jgi:acid stress chaperone HdeB
MKLGVLSATLAALLASSILPAQAETIDVADATCKEVLEMKEDDLTVMMMWTHGYFGGKAGDTKIDFEEFAKAGEVIGAACAQDPDAKWLDKIESLGG